MVKFLLLLFVSIYVVTATSEKEEWINFKIQHQKSYPSIQEEKLRYAIFQKNLKKVQEHNLKYECGESSYTMAINKFADLTIEEFREMLGFQKASKPGHPVNKQYFVPSAGDLPDSVDWSKKGAVTEVKDQGACGSCWSFSTTGTVEGQNFIKTGKLLSFSEQMLVDCDDTCYGCGGGWMDKALEWIEANGLMTEVDYPYDGYDEPCHSNASKIAVKISSFNYVKANDENALQEAVANVGPISVAIDASSNFMMYSSGILDDSACLSDYNDLNHGVLAVGYGSLNGQDYWIVKNSWGASWGQNGYIWMSRNKKNQCGIATIPVYPVI